MSDTCYPVLTEQLQTEQRWVDSGDDDELDWESALHALAVDGHVEALEALREHLAPIDYDELGWAD